MKNNAALSLPWVRRALKQHSPHILKADRAHAAVAMILNEAATGPELLFIVRAPCERDPWSGDIGFPGGRLEPAETEPRMAAERETTEELGLDLGQAECLGRLDDLYGATLPVLVSCYVYACRRRPSLTPNYEIAETFWFPLQELINPERHHQARLLYRGAELEVPAVDLLGGHGTVLWGITYRLIDRFFRTMGEPFGNRQVDACPGQIFR